MLIQVEADDNYKEQKVQTNVGTDLATLSIITELPCITCSENSRN